MIAQFLQGLTNCFKIEELRNKILFTLGILAVYRLGCYTRPPAIIGVALMRFLRA